MCEFKYPILQTQTSSVLQNDTVSSCSISKVQEKTQLSRIKCMNSLRAIQSQLKFLIETLQDLIDCKTTLTKLITTFENAFNSELKAQDSNSETASNKLVKECSLNSETKDVHAIKYKMSKAKERCMAYFRSLHSHLQVLSKDDLKGTRIEYGFKRAFMSLFGQDVDTFTSTMLLNVDQLQKQLDKDEFQEDGSMAAFWVYERRVNKRQMQTQESKIDTGKALDADLVDTKSIRTDSTVQDDSSRVDQYPETCQVKSHMLDSSPDNQTTEYSKQSLESEIFC
ncbi:hypothetical protein Tco_0045442 [Tanacetum coccineum]